MKVLEKLEWLWNSGWFSVWQVQVFLIVFGALLLNFIIRRVLKKIAERFQKTKNPWDDAFIHALDRPLSLLVWVLGMALAAHVIQAKTGSEFFNFVDSVRDVGIIVSFVWFLLRGIRNVENNIIDINLTRDKAYDKTTAIALGKLARLALMITGVLVALQTLGISVSGVVAFGGVGGIAIGFAARDLLANFFGGLMVFLDRPFSVGDWIRSPDRNIEGTVENVGWRLTRIRTFDKRPLYVPNSIFTNIVVENPSRMSNRRINETIALRYDDLQKMDLIVADVKAMLRNHEDIDSQQTLIVNFNAFNASSADFFIYTFTKTTEWVEFHEIKQAVLLKIAEIIAEHGAEMAFPTTTIYMQQGANLQSTGT